MGQEILTEDSFPYWGDEYDAWESDDSDSNEEQTGGPDGEGQAGFEVIPHLNNEQ